MRGQAIPHFLWWIPIVFMTLSLLAALLGTFRDDTSWLGLGLFLAFFGGVWHIMISNVESAGGNLKVTAGYLWLVFVICIFGAIISLLQAPFKPYTISDLSATALDMLLLFLLLGQVHIGLFLGIRYKPALLKYVLYLPLGLVPWVVYMFVRAVSAM